MRAVEIARMCRDEMNIRWECLSTILSEAGHRPVAVVSLNEPASSKHPFTRNDYVHFFARQSPNTYERYYHFVSRMWYPWCECNWCERNWCEYNRSSIWMLPDAFIIDINHREVAVFFIETRIEVPFSAGLNCRLLDMLAFSYALSSVFIVINDKDFDAGACAMNLERIIRLADNLTSPNTLEDCQCLIVYDAKDILSVKHVYETTRWRPDYPESFISSFLSIDGSKVRILFCPGSEPFIENDFFHDPFLKSINDREVTGDQLYEAVKRWMRRLDYPRTWNWLAGYRLQMKRVCKAKDGDQLREEHDYAKARAISLFQNWLNSSSGRYSDDVKRRKIRELSDDIEEQYGEYVKSCVNLASLFG